MMNAEARAAERLQRGDAEANAERVARVAPADTLSPADRYQELFVAVQTARVFPDSKTFVDCAPLRPPADILEAYRATHAGPDFDLTRFVDEHFVTEHPSESLYVSDPDRSLRDHIDLLWDVLTRKPREHPTGSSLLPLPHDYVVPGGRFGELYYWDSYFTMQGLAESGRQDLLRSMADDFAYLIDTYGHVPNGNRSYYLSRSQPPVFALMTELFEEKGVCHATRYLPRLRREHAYWMDGCDDLRPGEAHRCCVRMSDGAVLNRYWDDRDTPREESWIEDVTTARDSGRPVHEIYRELRAAAASGWDFSSRWCGGDGALTSIRTTAILPVDLNAFLHKLEAQIAQLAAAVGEEDCAERFARLARERAAAIDNWFWRERDGGWFDYDWQGEKPRDLLCAATATPLYVGLGTADQAARVAATLRARLLEPGGLATTCNESGQQWDAPNGWAPLQWIAIRGLRAHGQHALASEIAHRWLETVGSLYEREGKLVEKYVLRPARDGAHGGGGGEYELQDGFGWTNGVTRRLLHEAPRDPAGQVRAHHA